MPDPKKQKKKNQKATKTLKRGDRRPDGSIVGGITGKKPTTTRPTKGGAENKPTSNKPKKPTVAQLAAYKKRKAEQAARDAEAKKAKSKSPGQDPGAGAGNKEAKANKPSLKPLKRGDRRPDGSIVGGIAGPKPKPKPSNNKPIGKKSVNDSPETEARRAKEYKIAKGAAMAKEKKAKEKAAASKANAATKDPIKNLGTVSDGTAFYKRGPLFAHEAGHIDPTKEAAAKAKAQKEANKNAKTNTSNAKRVYGEATTSVKKTERGIATTTTTPWTQSGTGKGSAKFNTAYGDAKKSGKKEFNYDGRLIKIKAGGSKSGKDVKTTYRPNKLTPIPLTPVGIKFPPMEITAPPPPRIPNRPPPTTPNPAPPSLESFKGNSAKFSVKGLKKSTGAKKKNRTGSSCGCN